MLYKKEENNDLVWAIWKVEESTDELEKILGYTLNDINPKRLKERLATRVLLKTLLGDNFSIKYKKSGKPYLENDSFISISHTNNYAAISLSRTKETGIDIEVISEKVLRVKDRFISEKEEIISTSELEHLLIHWSAKEALYKIIDKKIESLKDDFILKPFVPSKKGNFTIIDTQSLQEYEGKYIVEKDFVVTII